MINRIGMASLAAPLAAMMAVALAGCGSGSDSQSVVRVTVTPANKTLATGSSASFSAAVTGTNNPAVRWSASRGTVNNPTANPVTYTAPGQAGTYILTATSAADSSAVGTATIRVTASGVAISLTPATLTTLQQGQQQPFTAAVTGSANTAVVFTATGGSFDNPNANSVVYTAPTTPGTYTVTATSQADVSQSASVTFTVPGISVTVGPPNLTVPVNTTQIFTATVTGAANTGVNFSVQRPGGVATSGAIITPSGAFIATQAGTYTVTATSQADNHTSASVTVTVKTVVTVTPPTQTVPQGGVQQFTAIVAGSTDEGVTWSIRNTSGSVIANGGALNNPSANPVTYTAPFTAGTYILTATSHFDGSTGTATITVPATSISVSPGTAISVPVNGTAVISAVVTGSAAGNISYSLQDVNGNPITTGGTLSSTTGSPVTYTAPATTGTFYLVVSNPGGGAPPVRITITVTPPTGSGVVIVQ